MAGKILLLRFCYWLGAILDAHAAIHLTLLQFRDLPAGIWAQKASYGFGISALWSSGDACALMWGWTALLLWADRKPVERRGVLLLTSFPVILMLLLVRVHIWRSGLAGFSEVSVWLYVQIGLTALFAFAALHAAPRSGNQSVPSR